MKISLQVVGRMKNGPEKDLFKRYWDRALVLGGGHNFNPLTLKEHPESKASRSAERMKQEAGNLLKSIDERAVVVAFDERGKSVGSPAFANFVRLKRDDGAGELVFVIGGSDGLAPVLRDRANLIVAFGAMTIPHQIVRILVAEQIYRAISILAGHPYHKI